MYPSVWGVLCLSHVFQICIVEGRLGDSRQDIQEAREIRYSDDIRPQAPDADLPSLAQIQAHEDSITDWHAIQNDDQPTKPPPPRRAHQRHTRPAHVAQVPRAIVKAPARQRQEQAEMLQTAEWDTLLRQKAALQASMHEQELLNTRERDLQLQLGHVNKQASHFASITVQDSATARFHNQPANEKAPEKLSQTKKTLIVLAFVVALVTILFSSYNGSKNFSKELLIALPTRDKRKAWRAANTRARVLFSWWPEFEPLDSAKIVRNIAHPYPPKCPSAPSEIHPRVCGCIPAPCLDHPEEDLEPIQAADKKMWVQIFHSRLFDNEKEFMRAYKFKERADAMFFMQLVAATLVTVLIPVEGSFDSPFVDMLLKITMMILAVLGSIVKGAEVAFHPKELGEMWLKCAETESELIYDLANLSDEFSVRDHEFDGNHKIPKKVFVQKYQIYLQLSSDNRTKIFAQKQGRAKDAAKFVQDQNKASDKKSGDQDGDSDHATSTSKSKSSRPMF